MSGKHVSEYIHFGSDHFDISRFNPIKNMDFPWVKPECNTGMWGSPVNSNRSWFQWCLNNDFQVDNLTSAFTFTLKEDSKILYVRNDTELDLLEELDIVRRNKTYLYDKCYDLLNDQYNIDFEKMKNVLHYDAIEVHINTERIYFGLYGWDCDSILILNPECVIETNDWYNTIKKYNLILKSVEE